MVKECLVFRRDRSKENRGERGRDKRRSSVDEPIRVAHEATTKADSALFLLVNSGRRTKEEGSTR